MKFRWEKEACELTRDAQSGAPIARLTSTLLHNVNIYYEQPYGSPDGNRIAYLRATSSDPRLPPGQQLCVADLETYSVGLLDDRVRTHWVANSPWSGHIYYLRDTGQLMHADLTTLKVSVALEKWPLHPDAYVFTASPDGKYVLSIFCDADYNCHLARIDLQTGACETIYSHPFIHGHVQLNHVNGRDILLQRNRGLRQNDQWQRKREPVEVGGATHVVVDIDGGEARDIRIGEPWTAASTGHASWVAGTGRMATPVQTAGGVTVGEIGDVPPPRHDDRHPEGNMLIIGPDDEKPDVFPSPEHNFNHASMSRCGRYFVADCFRHGVPGPIEIVVGNIETGKHRVLVTDCTAQGGAPACSHPHPYFTADNRRVIYNADPHHICHIHMATLPDGFLDTLA